jgi:1,2-diacylglycerol 3-beta-glucosyltransferase
MKAFVLGGVNAAAFMLCACFLAYVISIIVPLLRHRRGPTGDPAMFDWHFLVPCLNEEQVIAGTVSDLFKKFPTAHIWCIDDASSDSTHQIVSRMANRSPQVHVVSRRLPEAQHGKGPALNAGWKALVDFLPPDVDRDRIIVGVIDADGILDRRCPAIITGPTFFGDAKVSAVQILVRVVNPSAASAQTRLLTRMQDIEFSCVIAGMQMLRRHVGSSAMGGNGQFTRLSALQQVTDTYGTPWETALLEDFELGLRILLTGGQTEYCHDTWVAQQGPPTIARLIRQRSRWAQGLMQCFRYFLPVMRSRRISTGAAMEIAVFLLLPWFQLVGIMVYFVSLIVLLYYAFTTTGGPLHWFGSGAWGLIPLFLLFGLGPLILWGPIYRRTAARDLSLRQAALLGLVNWPYSYIHHVSTWWAFGRMLRSRHDWKKTERLDLPRQATIARPRSLAPPQRPRPAGTRPAFAGSGAGAAAVRPRPQIPLAPPPVSHTERWAARRVPAAAGARTQAERGSPASLPVRAAAMASAGPRAVAASVPVAAAGPGPVAAAPSVPVAASVPIAAAAPLPPVRAADTTLMAAGTLRVGHAPRRPTTRIRMRPAPEGPAARSAAPVVGGRLRLAAPLGPVTGSTPLAPAPALAGAGRGDAPD